MKTLLLGLAFGALSTVLFAAEIVTTTFGGIGVHLKSNGKNVIISSVIDGEPAYHARILPGSVLKSVNGIIPDPMDIESTLDELRGEPGIAVQLETEYRSETYVYEVFRALYLVKDRVLDNDTIVNKSTAQALLLADYRSRFFADEIEIDSSVVKAEKGDILESILVLDYFENIDSYSRSCFENSVIHLKGVGPWKMTMVNSEGVEVFKSNGNSEVDSFEIPFLNRPLQMYYCYIWQKME